MRQAQGKPKEKGKTMKDCGFCGLPVEEFESVFGVDVCADCVELAEIAFEIEEA